MSTDVDKFRDKIKAKEEIELDMSKNIQIFKEKIETITEKTAMKDELKNLNLELSKSMRAIERTVKANENAVATTGNYAENYIPFLVQKNIQQAFQFLTGNQYEKKMNNYFARIFRAIHHKILNCGGRSNLVENIEKYNKSFEAEGGLEDIGVPSSLERYEENMVNDIPSIAGCAVDPLKSDIKEHIIPISIEKYILLITFF